MSYVAIIHLSCYTCYLLIHFQSYFKNARNLKFIVQIQCFIKNRRYSKTFECKLHDKFSIKICTLQFVQLALRQIFLA